LKDDLSFIGIDNKPVTESGEFKVEIGNQSAMFNYQNTAKIQLVNANFRMIEIGNADDSMLLKLGNNF